jgi:hypothetical protein
VEEQECGQGKILFVAWMDGAIKGYLFEVNWIKTPQKWDICRAPEFSDRMNSGATGNAAIFFPERLYQKTQSEVVHLRIAAHTVLMGHRLDPGPIDGLEIVVCRAGKLRKLLQDELDSLRSFSNQLDSLMAKQFGNAPDMIG